MDTTVQVPPRQRLVEERMRRHWTQLEVADQLGTTPGNVSRWERGLTSPRPYFRRKLCELFGSSAQKLGLAWDTTGDAPDPLPETPALAASLQGYVPAQNSPVFTGHEDLLALLRTLLRLHATEALSSLPPGSGPGGRNLFEQEQGEQGRFAQAITPWLQIGANRVLIADNAGVVVLVVLNSAAGAAARLAGELSGPGQPGGRP